uniref:Uncharacterized protein n=1 Tax=Aegilops tauschii subsp. strangulata TaxID=200361 RepID=A0A453DEM3_AEGTS
STHAQTPSFSSVCIRETIRRGVASEKSQPAGDMETLEYVQIVGAPKPLPVAWLEGDVLAEYLQFLEEAAAKAAPLPGVKWLEGDVLANFLQFLGEDEHVVH